jgi:hypothetical protein
VDKKDIILIYLSIAMNKKMNWVHPQLEDVEKKGIP